MPDRPDWPIVPLNGDKPNVVSTDIVTLWVGPALGPIERACLRSVVRQGHRLALYCYAEPAGVPHGVEVRDAADILPEEATSAPWVARADLYSDWFRYELLSRGLGTWVDTDIYLVRPLEQERSMLFGRQAPDMLNNAVLRLRPDNPMLPRLLEPFRSRTTPSWLPLRAYLPSRLREFLHGAADLTRVPWGSTSPLALTAVAGSFGLTAEAQPEDVFYPVPWQHADWIRDPRLRLDDVVTPNTCAIHLWNECIKGFKHEPAPSGSFLSRLQEEGN